MKLEILRAGVFGAVCILLTSGAGASGSPAQKPDMPKPSVQKPAVDKPQVTKPGFQNETSPASRPHATARNPIALSDILPPAPDCKQDRGAQKGSEAEEACSSGHRHELQQ